MSPRYALASLIGLAGAGCGLDEAQQFQIERCESTADCGAGRSCRDMVCIDLDRKYVAALSAELTPPPTAQGLARTQVRRLALPGGEDVLDFELPEAAIFERTVVIDEARGEPIAASITISGTDRIVGRDVEARLSVSAEQAGPIHLLPGTYTARVLPLDGERPGLEVQNWIIRRAGNSPVKEFVLGRPLRRLYGEVSYRTLESEKLPGIRIRATSVPGGLASTEATSDSEGRYEIELPDTQDTAFRLTAMPAEPTGPTWSFRQIVNVPRDEARELDIGLEETGASLVGALSLSILGVPEGGGAPEPIAGAEVTLTATTSLPTRSFSVRGVTNQKGRVVPENAGDALLILASRYQVDVEPPPNAPYARTTTVVDLSRTGPSIQTDRQIALSARTQVLGQLTSSLGQNLVHASVSIDDLDRVIRPVQVTTDESGQFRVHLDPGRYLVRIEGGQTPATADVHPVAFARLDVSSNAGTVNFLHSLPSGRPVRGLVSALEKRTPTAGVDVEFFLEIDGRSVSLGRSITESDGRYSLVISGAELGPR